MNWYCSMATAQNTAHVELAYQQICVFLRTGTMLPDGRGQNRRFGTSVLYMFLLQGRK